MGQSRTESLLESLANQVVGISYAIVLYWYVFDFSVAEGFATTIVFSILGVIRVYVIRRIAEWRRKRKEG